MQKDYTIYNPDNNRLLLFFTGWSTDKNILRDISLPAGYDLMVVWDYRDVNTPKIEKRYDEIVILAWSFGVVAAQLLLPRLSQEHNITGLFAVNGSLTPINDSTGIPADIFLATLNGLSEKSLEKFHRRVCGGSNNYASKKSLLPAVPNTRNLSEELKAILSLNGTIDENSRLRWDCAFISEDDMIFPPQNLHAAWNGITQITLQESPHLPDFQYIINRIVRDKQSIGQNFSRNKSTYLDNALIQDRLALRLGESIKSHAPSASEILEIGGGAGKLTSLLEDLFPASSITVIDLTANPSSYRQPSIRGDAECELPKLPDNSFDIIASGSTLQWFHSPKKFLLESYRLLQTGGILAVTFFTEGTCKEISAISGASLLYHDGDNLARFAESIGFETLEVENESHKLTFDSALNLLKHLRLTGVNSVETGVMPFLSTKRLIDSMTADQSGDFPLTYVSCLLTLRKR